MKYIYSNIIIGLLASFFLVGFLNCSKNNDNPIEEDSKTLTVSTSNIAFQNEESSLELTINTNVDSWSISSSGDSWITISPNSGASGTTVVKITVLENTENAERSTTITINANEINPVNISVAQIGNASVVEGLYPNYNTNPIPADAMGMTSTASELAAKIGLGWNIGNTLEAIGGETNWGNPKITKALIDLVSQNGFNAIRIPCSWDQYLSNNAKAEIKTEWLDRVKEVVQYAIDNDMYVLLNIHWDGGWLENNVTEAEKETNNAKQKAFWEQIATHFRDFDEHLLFASANEPNVEDAIGMEVLTSYHQTFIDAVRATGGKNAYRTLVIQGPSTDIEKTNNLMTTLPNDTAVDRMMAEVHYYTPWQFCGLDADADWGKMFYYWGEGFHSTSDANRNATYGEEGDMSRLFQLMKSQFVDKGIPVVLGEYGAIRRSSLAGNALTLHLASRAYYLKMIVKQAKANGLLPFYWDNGGTGNNGFGIFDRNRNAVFDQQALDAMIEGLEE